MVMTYVMALLVSPRRGALPAPLIVSVSRSDILTVFLKYYGNLFVHSAYMHLVNRKCVTFEQFF